MSEEEIIKNLEEFLKGPCEICKYCDGAIRNHRTAIQGLLDLYQKEKEKNKELMKPKYILNNETGEITKLDNEFISKDKIRELIDKIFIDGYSYQDCIGEILELL